MVRIFSYSTMWFSHKYKKYKFRHTECNEVLIIIGELQVFGVFVTFRMTKCVSENEVCMRP